MNDPVVPRRLPLAFLVAPLVPSAVVGGLYAARLVDLVVWQWDVRVVALIWLATTLPMALVAYGIRRIDERWRPGPDPAVEAAIQALERSSEVMLRAEEFMQTGDDDHGQGSEVRHGSPHGASSAKIRSSEED